MDIPKCKDLGASWQNARKRNIEAREAALRMPLETGADIAVAIPSLLLAHEDDEALCLFAPQRGDLAHPDAVRTRLMDDFWNGGLAELVVTPDRVHGRTCDILPWLAERGLVLTLRVTARHPGAERLDFWLRPAGTVPTE